MLRSIIMAALACLIVSAALAVPPTQDNWWKYMDRYMGEFHLQSPDFREPVLSFSARWAEPRKLMHYASKSIGNAPYSQGAGFCSWNEATGRLEFQQTTRSEEEGEHSSSGFCINATDQTMTWVITDYNTEGVVRQYTMVDTLTDTGHNRSTEMLRGKDMARDITSWIKVE